VRVCACVCVCVFVCAPEREKERETRSEGTGIWPDYLVNRDDKKMRGHSGEKIAQKSRNSCRVNGRGCVCIGTVDSRRSFVQS